MTPRLLSATLAGLASLTMLVACGDDSKPAANTSDSPSTEPSGTEPTEGDKVVLVYEGTGGCMMMGPNCAIYTVYASGKVEIARGDEARKVEITGEVDQKLVDAWIEAVGDTDLDALKAELPEGTCQACVDGIDLIVTVDLPSGKGTLNSTEDLFDPENDFFKALDLLMQEVFAVGELEIQQR